MLSNSNALKGCILILYGWMIGLASADVPDVEFGAKVYYDRCVLCHGMGGMGEGILPLKLDEYPNTNLLKNIKSTNRDDIKKSIALGGSEEKSKLSEYMPPMGEELTFNELNAVTDFVVLLRKDSTKALALVNQQTESGVADKYLGKSLFSTRCALCHGKNGEGDGRMSKIIKNPPPSNFVKSAMPSAYLAKIIELGGEAMGRSPKMPPWGDQLNKREIESLVIYLESLRGK